MSIGTTIIEEEMAAAAAAATITTTTTRQRLRRPEWVSESKKKKTPERARRDRRRWRPTTADGSSGRPMDGRRPGPVPTTVSRYYARNGPCVCVRVSMSVCACTRACAPAGSFACACASDPRPSSLLCTLRVQSVSRVYYPPPPVGATFCFSQLCRNTIINSGVLTARGRR